MIGDIVKVVFEALVWNDTKREKQRLKYGDVLLLISENGYTRAVRLEDTNIFNFSHDDFETYTRPFLEADDVLLAREI